MNSDVRRWCFADQLGPHFLDAPEQPVLPAEGRWNFDADNRAPAPTRTSLNGSDASAATPRDARG